MNAKLRWEGVPRVPRLFPYIHRVDAAQYAVPSALCHAALCSTLMTWRADDDGTENKAGAVVTGVCAVPTLCTAVRTCVPPGSTAHSARRGARARTEASVTTSPGNAPARQDGW